MYGPCADPESLVRGGPTLTTFFFFKFGGGGGDDPITSFSRPSSACKRNAIKWRFACVPIMADIECWLGSFTILRGSGPVLLKQTYTFGFFQGGSGSPAQSLWIRACKVLITQERPHFLSVLKEILINAKPLAYNCSAADHNSSFGRTQRGIRLNHAEPICFMQISLKSNSQVFKVSVTMKYYCQLGFSNTAELIPNNSLIKPFKDRQSGE